MSHPKAPSRMGTVILASTIDRQYWRQPLIKQLTSTQQHPYSPCPRYLIYMNMYVVVKAVDTGMCIDCSFPALIRLLALTIDQSHLLHDRNHKFALILSCPIRTIESYKFWLRHDQDSNASGMSVAGCEAWLSKNSYRFELAPKAGTLINNSCPILYVRDALEMNC